MNANDLPLDELNPNQLQAVIYEHGSLLVLAGAGSGKTKVLVTRLAWLIYTKQINIGDILAVTFTSKAAREMLQRVSRILNIDTKFMWVGTFHAISSRFLRIHYKAAHLPANFQIIDAQEQHGLIKRLITSLNFDEDVYQARELQNYINSNKEHGHRASSVVVDGIRSKHWQCIYALYEETCIKHGLVDFTELLLRSYEMFLEHKELLQQYQAQFRHILVDEFQDTNLLQYKWLKLLVTDNTIFAVGDDDQSIYSFRGALVGNMQSFLTDFNVKEPLRLEQNYRSTQTILQAANTVIANNTGRIGKNLWTENMQTEKIKLYEGYTEDDEAYYVIDEIKHLKKHASVNLSEIAILYRSNAQSRVFEQHLYTANIPYKVYGGLRFFDRQEIKRILAYLRLLINHNDNEAFLQSVNFPIRGIGAKTIEILQDLAIKHSKSLFEAVEYMSGKTKITVSKFTDLINVMKVESANLSLSDTISYAIDKSGIKTHYENDKKDGRERLENLNELIAAVSTFTTDADVNPLVEFLAQAVLEAGDNHARDLESAVQLMTVHAAKGLEFQKVFIVGLEDGLFPYDTCLNSVKDTEEERRLMYVAITRAKESLYLLRACSRLLWGKRVSAPLSRFVSEIPNELIINISGISKVGCTEMIDGNDTDILLTNIYNENQSKKLVDNPETKISRLALKDKNIIVKIGDMIHHAKFGKGKILRLKTDGKKNTAEIFFSGIGSKILDLNIANLSKL